MTCIYLALGLILFSSTIFPTAGGLDSSFGTGGIVTTDIGSSFIDAAYASAVQPDGKIVVVGSSALNIAMVRYTVEGVLDSEFGTGGKVTLSLPGGSTDVAHGVAIQNNGSIVICGSSQVSTVIDSVVARFLPNGTLDTVGFNASQTPGYWRKNIGTLTSGSTTTDRANGVAIDINGNILVVGTNISPDTATQNIFISRYTSTGLLDTTFNSGGIIQPTTGGGLTVAGIAMLSLSSSLIGSAIALDSSNRIVVTGQDGATLLIVARFLNSSGTIGTLDTLANGGTGFGQGSTQVGYRTTSLGGSALGYALGFQSTGEIIVAGYGGILGAFAAVARFTTSGGLDQNFNTNDTPGYNAANQFGGTSAIAYGCAIQTDDNIVIGGTVVHSSGTLGDFVIARYLADGSALDSTFGTSSGYTTTDISGSNSQDQGVTLTLQQNGRCIVAGTTNANNNNFATVRYLGNSAPQGCMDVTYDPTGSTPGFITDPTDTTASHKPEITALQTLSSNSVFVLSQDLATTTKTQLVQIDSAGSKTSSNAIAKIDIAQIGGVDVISDSHGRALVVGGNGSNGWIARYVPTAGTPGSFALDTTFNSGSIIVQSSTPTTTAYSRVCEQESGNILAMGQNGTTGIIVAYNQNGTVNTNFGTSGLLSIATATFYDMIVNSSNGIFVVYADGNSPFHLKIAKYLANGSGLDTANFGTSGILDTGLVSTSYGVPKLAFDTSSNIIFAAINTSNYSMLFNQYASATGLTTNATGTILQTASLLTTPILTKLQCDTDNRPVCTGYDANVFFVARLVKASTTYSLDTTFAPYSSTQGILKTMYDDIDPSDGTTPRRVSNSVGIAPSGAILFGGYENITSSSTIAVVGQVVGDTTPYGQVARYPGAEIGQVDTTFGTSGALSLASMSSAGTPYAMNVLSNNKILVATATGGNTVLAQLTSAYALDTGSFGSGTGKITLTGLSGPKNIMVDTTGNIYVVGSNGTNVMLYQLSSAGVLNWSITTALSAAYANGYLSLQQSSGRIIVPGYKNSRGVVAGYSPINGALDTTFGINGYYVTTHAAPIIAAAITSNDKILFTYLASDNSAFVGRLLANGAVDSSFTFGTAIPSVSANDQIKLQLDASGRIIVVARNSTGFAASRYLATGANDVTGISIPLTNPSTATLQEILAVGNSNSNNSILILGSNTNGTTVEVARLVNGTTTFALDTSFDYASGTLQTTVSPMTSYYAIDVTSDQGIIIAGASSSPVPYMTRLFDDYVVTKVNQSTSTVGAAGTLNTDFNPTGTNSGFINMHTELATTQLSAPNIAKVIVQNSDGSYFVAADNGTNSYITKLSDDDVQTSTFGTSGVLTISGKINVSGMLIDQAGNLVVIGGSGSSGSNAGWVRQYNALTGVATSLSVTNNLDACSAIVEQTDGRYVIAGIKNTFGTLVAYNSVTGVVDTTFATNGFYTTAYTSTITSVVVDAHDYLYFIVNNGTAATTFQLSAFGALLWTGSTTIASATNACNYIAIDQNNDVVVVSVNSSNAIVFNRYDYDGSGTQLATLSLATGTTGFTTPVVSSLLIDTCPSSAGRVTITGYDSSTSIPFVLRVTSTLGGLNTAFNSAGTHPGIQPIIVPSATITHWNDGIINNDGQFIVAGYAVLSSVNTPYLMNLYGSDFNGQYFPTVSAGAPGTLNPNFGTASLVELASLSGASAVAGSTAMVVLPVSNGSSYIAFDNGNIMRITNTSILDTTYHTTGLAVTSNTGVHSMIMIGNGGLFLTGNSSGAGWVEQYTTAGIVDTTFHSGTPLSLGSTTVATVSVQQTLGRIVVAGQLSSGHGALFAFTNSGVADATFALHSSSGTGVYDTGITTTIYAFIADVYDRLIIAYKNGTGIDIVRLTSSGTLDTSFGSSGTISGAIANADQVTQVRLAFNSSGNIVVAAHFNDGANKIAAKAYANTTGTSVTETQLNITGLTSPTLTNLVGTLDGNVLVSGYQSGSNTMWVARAKNLAGAYILDSTFGSSGIMNFDFDVAGTVTARNLGSIAIYGDGQIIMVGSETDSVTSPTVTPFLSMAYNNPYTSAESICSDAQPIGTNDLTLGASSTTSTNLGLTFYGSSGAAASSGQVARAVTLKDDNNILVAIDGGLSSGSTTPSDIFLNMYDIDGSIISTFGSSGMATVLSTYQNQNVNDMVTFTTVAGVCKAILAGYVYNSTLGTSSSLLLQYNVTTPGLDSSFGGFNGNPSGIAFGDGQKINTIGVQTTGRIVAAGISKDNLGLLLGYTSAGKIDASFASGGYLSIPASTGLFTHTIDTQNRVIIAYRDTTNSSNVSVARYLADGSGLDTSFGTAGIVTTSISVGSSGNSFMRVAIDASNNVYLAAVNAAGTSVTINTYSASNGTAGAPFVPSLSLTTFTISRLLVDVNGKVIIVGYDSGSTPKQIVIARTNTSVSALDGTFNSNGTLGYLKYAVAAGTTTQMATDALIHPDGRILIVGAQS